MPLSPGETHGISMQTANKIILAIDYGTKAVGLALYCPERDPYPLPYTSLPYKDDDTLVYDLLEVIKSESVTTVVLGVPRLLDGKETTMTERIMTFGDKLEEALPSIRLDRHDESLSTFEAEERMKSSPRYNFKVNKKEIDALAASIILEEYVRHNP